MYVENVVVDALDPQVLGRFWEAAVGSEQLTDEPDGYETRLAVEGGPALDLCFQRVPEPLSGAPRVHLALGGGAHPQVEVERLLGLGATRLDVGPGHVAGVVLGDPEGNRFCVVQERASYAGTGPIAALRVASADPDRDVELWSWLTGWTEVAGSAPRSLRHASGLGPLLEVLPETTSKSTTKNRLHLDVRLEAGEDPDEVEAQVVARGGRVLELGWGDLPWRHYADPSGNEFCLLPSRS